MMSSQNHIFHHPIVCPNPNPNPNVDRPTSNRGMQPAVDTDMPNPLICNITPCTAHPINPLSSHISRVRHYSGPLLNMTEQIKLDVYRDHPDNIVIKLVGHQLHNGELWFMCRWRGFTAEIDSALPQNIILED